MSSLSSKYLVDIYEIRDNLDLRYLGEFDTPSIVYISYPSEWGILPPNIPSSISQVERTTQSAEFEIKFQFITEINLVSSGILLLYSRKMRNIDRE
jgi:hypothetical protein